MRLEPHEIDRIHDQKKMSDKVLASAHGEIRKLASCISNICQVLTEDYGASQPSADELEANFDQNAAYKRVKKKAEEKLKKENTKKRKKKRR